MSPTCSENPESQNHAEEETWAEYDARGYYLTRVCPCCVKQKLSKYRPKVLNDHSYSADEPFEPE